MICFRKFSILQIIILKFSAMIFVRIEVRGDDNAIAELSSGKCLLRLLTINHRIELNEYLQKEWEYEMRISFLDALLRMICSLILRLGI